MIIHSFSTIYGGPINIYNAHLVAPMYIEPGAAIQARAGTRGAGFLWGSGSVQVDEGGLMLNRTGSTWAANVLLASLVLTNAAVSTGCAPYDGGTGFPPFGVTLTAAHIDQYQSLADCLGSGAKFAN